MGRAVTPAPSEVIDWIEKAAKGAPREIGRAVEEAIKQFRAGIPLDRAFGVKPAPGQRSLSTTWAHGCIDELLLKEATGPRFENLSIREAARRLSENMGRLATASAWKHRRSDECPRAYVGTVRETCWKILCIREKVLAAKSIERILHRKSVAHELPVFVRHESALASDCEAVRGKEFQK